MLRVWTFSTFQRNPWSFYPRNDLHHRARRTLGLPPQLCPRLGRRRSCRSSSRRRGQAPRIPSLAVTRFGRLGQKTRMCRMRRLLWVGCRSAPRARARIDRQTPTSRWLPRMSLPDAAGMSDALWRTYLCPRFRRTREVEVDAVHPEPQQPPVNPRLMSSQHVQVRLSPRLGGGGAILIEGMMQSTRTGMWIWAKREMVCHGLALLHLSPRTFANTDL